MDEEKIENAVADILEAIGLDSEREGLENTPQKVAKMYQEIFSGVNEDPEEHLELVLEDEDYEDLVLVKDINFYSMCEHHLIPFFGKAHVAYIPKAGRVTGLSRLAKVVQSVAKRPQLQERMTKMIADAIDNVLDPLGVCVIVEAEQMCMTMRGIKQSESRTVTSAIRGSFRSDQKSREEVMDLIKD